MVLGGATGRGGGAARTRLRQGFGGQEPAGDQGRHRAGDIAPRFGKDVPGHSQRLWPGLNDRPAFALQATAGKPGKDLRPGMPPGRSN